MAKTTPEQNKALVLEAFDTLFNKRDYETAARFWSPTYIQHSAHIPPGRDGLFSLVKALPRELRYESALTTANGDYVMLHGRFSGDRTTGELDRSRHRACRERSTSRALGRHSGRGDSRVIEEWPADVRRNISRMMVIAKRSPTPRSPSANNPPSRAVRGMTMIDAGTRHDEQIDTFCSRSQAVGVSGRKHLPLPPAYRSSPLSFSTIKSMNRRPRMGNWRPKACNA